ncbi:hypothetical protein ACIGQE_21035 [Streptomyces sp. NPDC053429]|uniref:hypothetical protein n=1 Tax=Streptomyces sp. NPDC053429 TaxID=3365702 RepID=UPI0037D7DF35
MKKVLTTLAIMSVASLGLSAPAAQAHAAAQPQGDSWRTSCQPWNWAVRGCNDPNATAVRAYDCHGGQIFECAYP